MTPFALITTLGGYRDVAEALGRHPSSVHRWQDRGIPPECWVAMREHAASLGVELTIDDLAQMQPAPRAKMRRGRQTPSDGGPSVAVSSQTCAAGQ